jgi:hypothetical protein
LKRGIYSNFQSKSVKVTLKKGDLGGSVKVTLKKGDLGGSQLSDTKEDIERKVMKEIEHTLAPSVKSNHLYESMAHPVYHPSQYIFIIRGETIIHRGCDQVIPVCKADLSLSHGFGKQAS